MLTNKKLILTPVSVSYLHLNLKAEVNVSIANSKTKKLLTAIVHTINESDTDETLLHIITCFVRP